MSAPQKPIIQFSEHASESLALLKERWGMSPNGLSNTISSHFMRAAILPLEARPHTLEEYASSTHAFKLIQKQDIQTLEATKANTTQYQIYLAGNNQAGLKPECVQSMLEASPNTNHIFKNYSRVDKNHQNINQINPLFKPGYEEVKTLLDKGIPAENITLYGYSFGGGIAAQIAKKLHDEGFCVNLTIDRSFSSLSSVIASKTNLIHQSYLPLGTSLAAFSMMGASLGLIVAGLIASIGVLIESFIANLAYYCCLTLSKIPGLALLASYLDIICNQIAQSINLCFNLIASVIGAAIAFTGFLAGAVVGALTGAILSLQLLVTDTPVGVPLEPAVCMFLNTTTGEMNSVRNVQHILNLNKHGKVKILNSKTDNNIPLESALNTGLGFTTHSDRNLKQYTASNHITSLWYNKASHFDNTLKTDDIDFNLNYPKAIPAV
ncbi:MAG: hypothetical protein K0U37_00680 [Gammaproteobacteria bacterium]|nr:hypothetical protein [Gammaproteobacteria bacterium]